MKKLCINELLKLYQKKLIIVFFVLILLGNISAIYLLKASYTPEGTPLSGDEWKGELLVLKEGINEQIKELSEQGLDTSSYDRNLWILNYQINNITEENDWRNSLLNDYEIFQEYSLDEIIDICENKDWRWYCEWKDNKLVEERDGYHSASYGYYYAQLELDVNQLRYKFDIPIESGPASSWKNKLLIQYCENRNSILLSDYNNDQYHLSVSEVREREKENIRILYQLEHDIQSNQVYSVINYMKYSSALSVCVMVAVLALAVMSLGIEDSQHAIRQLFLYPYPKWKIFLSKYTVLAGLTLVMLGIMYLSSLIFGVIFFGKNGIYPEIIIFGNDAFAVNGFVYTGVIYLLRFFETLAYIPLTFLAYQFLQNSSVAIVVSAFLAVGAKLGIHQLSSQMRMTWTKYIPFVWTDWNQFWNGSVLVDGLTPALAIIGTLIITIVLYACSMKCFENCIED